MDRKLMEFWLDEEKGQGILLPEGEGKRLGLKAVETKSVKPAETKELRPAEDKAVSTPLPTPPLSPSKEGVERQSEGVVKKPKATGKK